MKSSRKGWLPILSLILSIYSSTFSGLFVVIAVSGPRYGKKILPRATFTPSSTALATAVIAKTIEITFVTVFMALLGQELSRRASGCRRTVGVSLADMHMRNWIMQPGTMISKWESLRYAGYTKLGLATVVAALLAMLYTSAATALVQPQLRFVDEPRIVLQGLVKTSFGNSASMTRNCSTPRNTYDALSEWHPCTETEQSEDAMSIFNTYLRTWKLSLNEANGTSLVNRPRGTSSLTDGTLVLSSWLNGSHGGVMQDVDTGVFYDNVSLAFPHMGVISACRYSENNIIQPEDLDGLGSYNVNASVPSPVLHTICATVSEQHLSPLLLDHYSPDDIGNALRNSGEQLNATHDIFSNDAYPKATTLDHIFGWGPVHAAYNHRPTFPRLPKTYEVISNGTTGAPYARSAIYALGKVNMTATEESGTAAKPYFLCQMQISQTPYCFTNYQAVAQRTILQAICDEPQPHTQSSRMSYSMEDATVGADASSRDLLYAALSASLASSLGIGSSDDESPNARLLSELVRSKKSEPGSERPSLAEALAILSSGIVTQATRDAPFVPFFNYTAPGNTLPIGVTQFFNASVRSQQYASGGSNAFERLFNAVLVGVFVFNLAALVYFVVHKDWYTDISEPTILFSLAVNASPSQQFPAHGASSPKGKDYSVTWVVDQNDGHVCIRESREKKPGSGTSDEHGLED
jgi:hypothetical protein